MLCTRTDDVFTHQEKDVEAQYKHACRDTGAVALLHGDHIYLANPGTAQVILQGRKVCSRMQEVKRRQARDEGMKCGQMQELFEILSVSVSSNFSFDHAVEMRVPSF